MNRKIKNATTVEYNGIIFRSKQEKAMYNKMVTLGYTPEYEADKFVLSEGFNLTFPLYIDGTPQLSPITHKPLKVRDWTYTPDFKLTLGDIIVYIEVKGFGNDLWPYKRKLFLKLINSLPNVYFFEVHTIRGLLNTLSIIKQIYEKRLSKLY